MIKGIVKSGIKYITNKDYRFLINASLGKYNSLSDLEFLRKKYYAIFHRELNLENPHSFNEKLQWIKLFDRKDIYTTMVDKVKARDYVASIIGEKYLVPIIGIWDNAEEIDFDSLPNQFVLKCNHNSGLGMIICKDKSSLDISNAKSRLKKGLAQDYYLTGREWPYKNVERKIIGEQYMGDSLVDYKFQCFNGQIDDVFVCRNRFSSEGVEYYYFDRDWNYLPYSKQIDPSFNDFLSLKPSTYDIMINLVEALCAGIPEIRVDLYEINNQVYFGELTFFSQSGFDTTITNYADIEMGEHFNLPL